jgi:F-type H+-transporting ATPase subunit a
MAPFLILLELISYIARVFSLSIRLFANMMSGHALLKILIGFAWILLNTGNVFILLAPFP